MKSKADSAKTERGNPVAPEVHQLIRRHLIFGWSSLLVFLTLGILLEALHGFKVGAYLDVSKSMRRLMWTLGHAHGTLLSLVQIAFAFTIRTLSPASARRMGLASSCLLAANVLIPAGFVLGGAAIYEGDPGLGIVLVPIGAILLFTGVFLTARVATLSKGDGGAGSSAPKTDPQTQPK